MSQNRFHAPSSQQLLRATVVAVIVAAAILITIVLPAEYGIDPTGLGSRMGLTVLHEISTQDDQANNALDEGEPTPRTAAKAGASAANSEQSDSDRREAELSAQVFGPNAGQSFATAAVTRQQADWNQTSREVSLEPGKGAELKVELRAGESLQFHWQAGGAVAVDMHGDRTDAGQDEYTSYWISGDQVTGRGTLIAPFDGKHGWYWQNRSNEPINVRLEVSGFGVTIIRPGHDD